jgi:arsenate reductase-like glutaredoxin family protein
MNKIVEGIMEVKNMKPEEFRKQKEEYEKIIKKQITDEEFERLLQKFQNFFQTLYEKREKGQITGEKFERLLRNR